MPVDALAPYDGVLLLSFGGPESPEEVMPFLRRVTAGRGIPDERLAAVAAHYDRQGGRSPINDQNRALIGALRDELARRDIDLPVLWGNRNSAPFLQDTLREAAEAGLHRLVTVLTSAYPSYSSCRQYRENLAAALGPLRESGEVVLVDKLAPYALSEPFRAATSERLVEALRDLERDAADEPEGTDEEAGPVVLFVTHSVPVAMDETSGPGDGEGNAYVRHHLELASEATTRAEAALGRPTGWLRPELVFCSRSGPPTQPWLEPDIGDRLRELAAQGREALAAGVVIAPIGFVSDHMEVVNDLDVEALGVAAELGVRAVRAGTVGISPTFVGGLVDLVVERAAVARGEREEHADADLHLPAVCRAGCCPNLRRATPAACGEDEDR